MYTISETWFERISYRSMFFSLLWTLGTDRNSEYKGFEFMEALVADMVQDDPTKRPTMDEVVTRFSDIKRQAQYVEAAITDSSEI
jgi:hypothetical protein